MFMYEVKKTIVAEDVETKIEGLVIRMDGKNLPYTDEELLDQELDCAVLKINDEIVIVEGGADVEEGGEGNA